MDQASDDSPKSPAGVSQKAGSKRKAPATDGQAVIDLNSENLDALMRANDALMSAVLELTQEILAFNATRLQENVRRSQTLMSSKDPEEAFRAQSEFFQSALQQYVEQTGKMLALMTKMNRECWAPWEARVKEAIQGLEKR